jgi:Domain of unknown function (DUF3846)
MFGSFHRRRRVAYLIKTSGEVQEVRPANGSAFTLEELQAFVGGYIEIVYALRTGKFPAFKLKINPGDIMVINEEGKIKYLTSNSIACTLYKYAGYDTIVGDVVVGNQTELGG